MPVAILCPHGYCPKRDCDECRRYRYRCSAAKMRAENPDRVHANDLARYRRDKPKRRAANEDYKARNRESYLRTLNTASKRWKKAHPGALVHYEVTRKARKRGQRCHCCSDAAIELVYEIAHALGAEVDHKTPLALGGAHCTLNFQVLTPEAHKIKTKADMALIAAARRARRLP